MRKGFCEPGAGRRYRRRHDCARTRDRRDPYRSGSRGSSRPDSIRGLVRLSELGNRRQVRVGRRRSPDPGRAVQHDWKRWARVSCADPVQQQEPEWGWLLFAGILTDSATRVPVARLVGQSIAVATLAGWRVAAAVSRLADYSPAL